MTHIRRAGDGLVTKAMSVALTLLLVACSGGGGNSAEPAATAAGAVTSPTALALSTKPNAVQAARLLTQATFGPSWGEIERLSNMTQGAWLEEQFAQPSAAQHKDTVMARITAIGDYGRLGKYFPHPYSSPQEAFHPRTSS